MLQDMRYQILIPAYNAAHTIGELLKQIEKLTCKPNRIIVIDDGSTDLTAETVKKHDVVLIQLGSNHGKGYALQRGIAYFLEKNNGSLLLTLDADLQHPVPFIPVFLASAEANDADLIIGARKISFTSMPLHRVLSNRITSWILSRLTGLSIPDSQCGFRLMHRSFLQGLQLHEHGFQAESEMILEAARLRKKIAFIAIPTIYRPGNSNMKHIGDTLRFVRLVLRNIFNK